MPDDLTSQLRTLAHACVSGQERLEREHGEYDVKAALWALGSLRGCIDAEPLDCDAATYRHRLLARMRTHHEHYRSDSFIEEYGGGRASMGSAIHAFESQSEELLAASQPARQRWPVYVWLLLIFGFLLAVANLHAEEATPAPTAEINWSPIDLALLPYGWRKYDYVQDDFDGDGCSDSAVIAVPREVRKNSQPWRLFIILCTVGHHPSTVVDLGKWTTNSKPSEMMLGVIDPGVIFYPLLPGNHTLRLHHTAIKLVHLGTSATVIYWDDKRGDFSREWLYIQ